VEIPRLGRGGIHRLAFTGVPGATRGHERAIVEADIVVNAVHYHWDRASQARLTRVLAHEVGHVLGLRDACAAGPLHDAPRRCGEEPQGERRASVMHYFYQWSKGSKLGRRDHDFLCQIYPAND